MKVLMVAGEFPPMQGGVGDFTRRLSEALADDGCDVTVFTSEKAKPQTHHPLVVQPLARGWGWRDLWHLYRLSRGFDVVNLQYQAAAYGMKLPIHLLPFACKLAGVPLAVTFHDLRLPYLFPKAGPLRVTAMRWLLEQSAASIVTNEEDLVDAPLLAPAVRPRLVRIGSNIEPVPFDEETRQRKRREWGIPPSATVLCYFGFLNATKGAMDLVRALALVRERGEDVRLVFIGGTVGSSDTSNVSHSEQVQAEIARLGLESAVLYTGFVDEEAVSTAFYACDICVLPFLDGASYRRGSLMAALAHGMPIITTIPQVPIPALSSGEVVAIVHPEQPGMLADEILRLAHDQSERERLSKAAKELAQAFSWEVIAADTIEIYRTISGRLQ